jgi:calcineurin-like phosphoesterase family protein
MDIWFTSDTHYGHANIIKYDNRPFADVEEHDEGLIERFNAVVKPTDTVYHLGDFAFAKKPEDVTAIVKRLNGQKHLLLGNHDRHPVKKSEGWASIRSPYHELKVDLGGPRKQKIVLSHYPLLTWNGAHHGSWMLHGHCHGTLTVPETTRVDVGVPCWDYTPINLEMVQLWMNEREYGVVDQHEERTHPCKTCKGTGTQMAVTRGNPAPALSDPTWQVVHEELGEQHAITHWSRRCTHCEGKGHH